MSYTIGATPRVSISPRIRPDLTSTRLPVIAPGLRERFARPGAESDDADDGKSNTALIVGGVVGLAVLAYALSR
jgi:hypothetical protein